MSLTSEVNDNTSIIWQMLRESGGDRALNLWCYKKTSEMQHDTVTSQSGVSMEDRMIFGMAMRYALMEMWGLNYLADHPVSRHYKQNHGEDFGNILASFGEDKAAGFLYLALLDKQDRGGKLYAYWQNKLPEKVRGVMRFKNHDARLILLITEIGNLYGRMQEHFKHPSIVGQITTCPYCTTTQIPGKVWSCQKCGAPLTYKGVNVSGVSLSNKPDYRFTELLPTYAGHIGGADAPLAIGWKAFSIRTVSKPVVSPMHVLMAWGWWALYDENDCPPWQTATIYYSRQAYEVTFEFESMHKMLGIDLSEFHTALEDAVQGDRDEFSIDSIMHEEWGDRG
jgi:hypothetical protein